MVVAPKGLLQRVGDLLLNVEGYTIFPSCDVRNLGVILDSTPNLNPTSSLSPKLPSTTSKTSPDSNPHFQTLAETLIHALITSCLDYCNGVLCGVPNKRLDRPQYVHLLTIPTLWNALPIEIRNATFPRTIKKLLKTHLFKNAYDLVCYNLPLSLSLSP